MFRRFLLYLRRQSDVVKNLVILSVSGFMTVFAIFIWLMTDSQALNFGFFGDVGNKDKFVTKSYEDMVDTPDLSNFFSNIKNVKEEIVSMSKEAAKDGELSAELHSSLGENGKFSSSSEERQIKNQNTANNSVLETEQALLETRAERNIRASTSYTDVDYKNDDLELSTRRVSSDSHKTDGVNSGSYNHNNVVLDKEDNNNNNNYEGDSPNLENSGNNYNNDVDSTSIEGGDGYAKQGGLKPQKSKIRIVVSGDDSNDANNQKNND